MEIGLVGLGVVGNAVKYGFEKLGHNVLVHDIKLDTKLEDLKNTEACFVCVPTPANEDFSCNTSIVESVVAGLNNLSYEGLVSIKSTVQPGTVDRLKKDFPNMRFAFVPEFLRERCAVTDFTENHDVCIIGAYNQEDFKLLKKIHGRYPRKVVHLSPLEAELSKYFNNIYNATLITFANSFYEVCESLGANYSNVKNAVTKRDHIQDIYLDCNDNFRGFAGMCLPKDTKAIAALCQTMGLDIDFFHALLRENAKYKITVFEGMRVE